MSCKVYITNKIVIQRWNSQRKVPESTETIPIPSTNQAGEHNKNADFKWQQFDRHLVYGRLSGGVPFGGPKRSPRSSSIVKIIFSVWSFVISEI